MHRNSLAIVAYWRNLGTIAIMNSTAVLTSY